MTPSVETLNARDLWHLAHACRTEASAHELELMFGACRCRGCARGRAKFYNALRHSFGWSVRLIADFTGRTVSAVHAAVYHGQEASR